MVAVIQDLHLVPEKIAMGQGRTAVLDKNQDKQGCNRDSALEMTVASTGSEHKLGSWKTGV